jgi:hypothetical protein
LEGIEEFVHFFVDGTLEALDRCSREIRLVHVFEGFCIFRVADIEEGSIYDV